MSFRFYIVNCIFNGVNCMTSRDSKYFLQKMSLNYQ